jgi:hypothetical protein
MLFRSTALPTFSGNVSDLDAGDDYLTVTNPANQTTQTLNVTSETGIVTANGKPSQLLNLIEGTVVRVDADRVTEGSLQESPSYLMSPRSRLEGRNLERRRCCTFRDARSTLSFSTRRTYR